MFGKLISTVASIALPKMGPFVPAREISSLANTVRTIESNKAGGSWSLMFVRNKVRYYFPRPSENKRIKRHGFWARMATPGGRKILMRRILKGRYVLSH